MRILFLICLLCTSGCATVYPECEKYTDSRQKQECINDAEEYDRVERLLKFKAELDACRDTGGRIGYVGLYTARMARILDTEDWERLRRTDMVSFYCLRK